VISKITIDVDTTPAWACRYTEHFQPYWSNSIVDLYFHGKYSYIKMDDNVCLRIIIHFSIQTEICFPRLILPLVNQDDLLK